MHKIFLDLEETIIRSWGDPTLVNVRAIKDWLDEAPVRPTTVVVDPFAELGDNGISPVRSTTCLRSL